VQLNFDQRVVPNTQRLKDRLLVNPVDAVAVNFFDVLDEWKAEQDRV
jgi:hypothetical protein